MKEIKGFTYRELGTAESRIKLEKDPKVDYELKILDKNEKEIEEYDYISPTDSEVVIIIKVDISNGSIRVKNMPEYERKIKEAHKKLLKEKKPELFNRNEKQGHRSSNIEFNITEENGKMQLTFYKKGETGLTPRVFSEDRIDIQPEYYETIKITHAEGGEKIEEETDKLQPTTG
ncbi:33518_t:CDS:2 [Racocetra persica]|uniref:33518_t:CDS:1 n=1 Tax=Racocetra persica TaxID=160502 RepID=A0ACA9RWL5_9GLOM|nr:33518_t:CDS:2 [Racocetra persica]